MENEVKVSVLCFVYNHERFLRKCLESIVNQKTNFKYEILIHDDASTDSSIDIIKEFHIKYPDKISPVYEKENQYSQGKNIITEIMFPMVKGKYIAFCEGDDYWCDVNKLQKQYDCMEKDEECVMCVHNTIIHDLLNSEKDRLFNEWKNVKILNEKDIFFDWNVHTTSYFIRRDICNLPEFTFKYWFVDFVILTILYDKGKIIYLPDVMSVYNYNNTNGMTYTITNSIDIEKLNLRREYLIEYNKYTKNKLEKTISKRLSELNFEMLLSKKINTYKEFRDLKKELNKTNEYYIKYKNKLSLLKKFKFSIKYNNFFSYMLVKKIKSMFVYIKEKKNAK